MRYGVFRALFNASLHAFFRRVEVQGADRIPESGPLLLISNHTNAFVDPLVVLTRIRRPVAPTAKSTLVKNPLMRVVIWGLDAVLLHRQSDVGEGADTRKNVAALDACVARLRAGGAIFVFPEGISHSDPAMRGFKTGAARIVARYLEDPAAPPLAIVPVGLHYSKKDRWRSEAVALVGDPVDARAWADREGVVDPSRLTEAMRSWIEALTVGFESGEERALIEDAERLFAYRSEGPEPLDRPTGLDASVLVDRMQRLQRGAHLLRARDPALFEATARETRTLARELDALGVDASEVGLPMHAARVAMFVVREMEVLIVGAPVALWGWLVHLPPLTLTRRLVVAMSQDEDHPASNAVFLSIPIFLTWWVLVLGASAVLFPLSWLPVIAASLPFAAAVHLRYRDRVGSVRRRMRTFLLWLRRPELRQRLEAELSEWRAKIEALEPALLEADPEAT